MKQVKLVTEQARLNEVAIYKSLQEFCIPDLQSLVNMASNYFSVPIVYISLIDEFKQVVMAKKGITLEEMRKEDTFCHHVINNGTTLIINDASRENNFKSNSLVEYYPHIRFYAGTPFVSKNGYVLGAFCICDTKFRLFTNTEEKRLTAFSKLATEIIENNLLTKFPEIPESDILEEDEDFSSQILKELRINLKSNYMNRLIDNRNSLLPITSLSACDNPENKSNDMYPAHQNFPDLVIPHKSNMYLWGEMMIGSYKREVTAVNFSNLSLSVATEFCEELKQKRNRIEWDITETPGWQGDETVIKYLCHTILRYVNNRNQNSTIKVNTFNDEDYAIMVIRHQGDPLVRSELDNAYKSSPHMIDSKNKEDLYYCWQTLKLISGFMTVPESSIEKNFITIGFPKKKLTRQFSKQAKFS
jgi:GAF domain-containing protein